MWNYFRFSTIQSNREMIQPIKMCKCCGVYYLLTTSRRIKHVFFIFFCIVSKNRLSLYSFKYEINFF